MATNTPVPYEPEEAPEVLHHVKLNVTRSALDVRDYIMGDDILDDTTATPPAHIIPKVAPVYDQGHEGSCTANGYAGMYRTELLRLGRPDVDVSRAFIYYEERKRENQTGEDNGAAPRDGALVLKDEGVCKEALMPYVAGNFTVAPDADAYADAANQKISAFYRVPGLIAAKHALAKDRPVGLAMLVFQGMMASKNGVIPVPDVTEQPLGGHWVYVIGYTDDATWPGGGYLQVRNSWGAGAGDGTGMYFLPYQMAGNNQICLEMWMIVL